MNVLPLDIVLHIAKSLNSNDLMEWRSTCKHIHQTLHQAIPSERSLRYVAIDKFDDLEKLVESPLLHWGSFVLRMSLPLQNTLWTHLHIVALDIQSNLRIHKWPEFNTRTLESVTMFKVAVTLDMIEALRCTESLTLDQCCLHHSIESLANHFLTIRTSDSRVPQMLPGVKDLSLCNISFSIGTRTSGLNRLQSPSCLRITKSLLPDLCSLPTRVLVLSLIDHTINQSMSALNVCMTSVRMSQLRLESTICLTLEDSHIQRWIRCTTLTHLSICNIVLTFPGLLCELFPSLVCLSIDQFEWLDCLPCLFCLRELHLPIAHTPENQTSVTLHHLPSLQRIKHSIGIRIRNSEVSVPADLQIQSMHLWSPEFWVWDIPPITPSK
jgi:hypothetical protein